MLSSSIQATLAGRFGDSKYGRSKKAGEELFFDEADYEPYIKVQFDYRSEYYDTYGRSSDVLEFYKSDDRKSIVRVNGDVLYKVRQVYTDRLLSNLDALLNGGDIELNW